MVLTPFESNAQVKKDDDKLAVLWTSDDPYVADRVALMYTHAAARNHLFKEVTLIIWGPSAKLVAENKKIQKKLMQMKKDGVKIRACIACATAYDVVDDLKQLNFEVAPMAIPLTDYLKDDQTKVLTF
ncbi:DsrE family protein [Halosquirtibacter xylanolyticus]|nr:DsrE family protein [Prolixibacteraceae bacterium]